MRTGHLSEDEVQRCALDASGCEADIIQHIESCEGCKTKVTNYRLLFAGIQEQPRPAFDFDVAGIVLSQYRGKTKELARNDWPLYLLIFALFSLIGLPLYWLRKDIAIMFAGMLPITISLATLPIILVFLFQGIELFRKYKWRSDALNF